MQAEQARSQAALKRWQEENAEFCANEAAAAAGEKFCYTEQIADLQELGLYDRAQFKEQYGETRHSVRSGITIYLRAPKEWMFGPSRKSSTRLPTGLRKRCLMCATGFAPGRPAASGVLQNEAVGRKPRHVV
jgi:hypothetical protein